MENFDYKDYDLLLQYQMRNKRDENIYTGNSRIYEDGRFLEIFPEDGDKINGKEPIFVIGTVVYLHYEDKFLILKQTKDNRVTDTLLGLGGKVAPLINQKVLKQEKNNITEILNSYKSSSLSTAEDLKLAAAREVMEETSTYEKNENGIYTHNIIKKGIEIAPQNLNMIGCSRIRITNNEKTECWLIHNYFYELTEKEYEFIEESVSKTNREGILSWMSIDEILPYMSNTDRIILKNYDKKVSCSEIRDNVNNENIVRFVIEINNTSFEGTIINGDIVYITDENFIDMISNIGKKKS